MAKKEKSYAQRVAEFIRGSSQSSTPKAEAKPKPSKKPKKEKESIAKQINWPGA